MTGFGEALRRVRVDRRITLKQLSKFTKKSMGYLSDIEHERRRPPDLETVNKIEESLGINDGSLVNMASKLRKNISPEVTNLLHNNPRLSEALLRADDEDIERVIKSIKGNRRKETKNIA
jgi:transcriptional regulator with XRE-family HTH domain